MTPTTIIDRVMRHPDGRVNCLCLSIRPDGKYRLSIQGEKAMDKTSKRRDALHKLAAETFQDWILRGFVSR